MNSAVDRHNNVGEDSLFQEGNYSVFIGELKDGSMGYYVLHTDHGIVQHETSLFFDAMKWCKICHSNEDNLLKEPETPTWPPNSDEAAS